MESSVDQLEYEVIRRARFGEESALGTLIDTHAGALIGYIDRIVKDSFQAEDIAQETFIRAFDHLDKFDPRRPFRPWLFKIGRNLALNYVSSRAGRERIESRDISERRDIGTDAGPEEALDSLERKRGVEMILEILPAHFREVLHLRYMEGLEYDAIATALGLPIGTVKTWLFRAKKAFLVKAEASGIEF